MKKLILLLMLVSFSLYGDEKSEFLTAKFDQEYYSPITAVDKIDIILPDKPKRDFYLLNVRFEGKRFYNFNQTFAINTNGSIYLYIREQRDLSGKRMKNTSLNFTIRFGKKERTYGFGFLNYKKLAFKISKKSKLKFDHLLDIITLTDMTSKNKKLYRKYKLSFCLCDKQKNNDIVSLLKKEDE